MIDIYEGRKKFLWGIDSTESISDIPNFPYKLFKENGSSSRLGPLNSIRIGFKLEKLVPVNAEFVVKI